MKTYKVEVNDNGATRWYNEEGRYHREDGPAIESAGGSRYWYINGKRHREDGPAVESVNGDKYWYINDKRLTEEEFNNRKKPCIGKKVIIDGIEYTLS